MSHCAAIFTSNRFGSGSIRPSVMMIEDAPGDAFTCRLVDCRGAEALSRLTTAQAGQTLTSLAPQLLLGEVSMPPASLRMFVELLSAKPLESTSMVIIASGTRAVRLASRDTNVAGTGNHTSPL